MKKKFFKVTGIINFIVSVIFLIKGFYKFIDGDFLDRNYYASDSSTIGVVIVCFQLASFFLLLAIGSSVFYFFIYYEIPVKKRSNFLEEKKKSNFFKDKKITINSADDIEDSEELTENFWVCPKCGLKNKLNKLFCTKCDKY